MGRSASGQDAPGAGSFCILFEVKPAGLRGRVLVVGWEWAAGVGSEKQRSCPHARHNQFQPVP